MSAIATQACVVCIKIQLISSLLARSPFNFKLSLYICTPLVNGCIDTWLHALISSSDVLVWTVDFLAVRQKVSSEKIGACSHGITLCSILRQTFSTRVANYHAHQLMSCK